MESLSKKATTGHWAALGSIALLALVGVPWTALARAGLVEPGYGTWAALALVCAAALGVSAVVTLVGYACGRARKQGVFVSTVSIIILGSGASLLLEPQARIATLVAVTMALITGNIASQPGEKRRLVGLVMFLLWGVPVLVLGLILILLPSGEQPTVTGVTRALALACGPWASLFPVGRSGVALPMGVPVSIVLTVLLGATIDMALRAKRTDIPGLCLVFYVPMLLAWLGMGIFSVMPGFLK